MDRLTFGSEHGLAFELEWSASTGTSAADRSAGKLVARVAGAPVWGSDPATREIVGIDWTWVELLEHLAVAWPYLEIEESTPLGIDARPDRVLAFAEERWRDYPVDELPTIQRSVFRWVRSHDLSNALQGLHVPGFWLLRRGRAMRVVAGDADVVLPLSETLRTLADLGAAIVARIDGADARARQAVAAWMDRDAVAPEDFVAIATGLPDSTLSPLVGDDELADFWELGDAAEPTELLAAARMGGPRLPPTTVTKLLDAVRSCPRRATKRLDALATKARGALVSGSPHEQGYEVAWWLRTERLRLRTTDRVEPLALLETWNVEVQRKTLDVPWIDAVACWGPRHGPGVVLNNVGVHAQFKAGRRATLAHEIAHLLLDREDALPLSDVVGGVVAPELERRANAFAAELLVPREAAGAELAGKVDAKAVVATLCRRYGASTEIVAWQAKNSSLRSQLEKSTTDYLRTLVTYPERF